MVIEDVRFMEMVAWAARERGIKQAKVLAQMTGIHPNTFTRAKNGEGRVTDDTFWKFNNAFGNIFNILWFHGQDLNMFLDDYATASQPSPSAAAVPAASPAVIQNETRPNQLTIDQSSLVNALIAAHADTVAALKRELVEKEDHLATLRSQLADKDRTIKAKDDLIATLRQQLSAATSRAASSYLTDYPFPIGAADQPNTPQIPLTK